MLKVDFTHKNCPRLLKQDCNRLNSVWRNAPGKWFTCMHSTAFFYRTTSSITKSLRIKYTSRCEAGRFQASVLPDHICQGCCWFFPPLPDTLACARTPTPTQIDTIEMIELFLLHVRAGRIFSLY